MNEELTPREVQQLRLGPPPLKINIPAPLDGPAFTIAFKCIATLLIVSISVWFFQLYAKGAFNDAQGKHGSGLVWIIAALALLALTYYFIIVSRTRLDAEAIEQSWVWQKRMLLADVIYVRVIRYRALDWLIAPRAYVRSYSGKFMLFYSAHEPVIAKLEEMAHAAKALRQ